MWFAGAMGTAVGLLLAAGSGSRMGGPKALVRGAGGEPWARAAARSLHEGGCPQVVAVLGAAGGEAEALLADLPWVSVVHAQAWAVGMGSSLRAGLDALEPTPADCAVVGLVDTPDVGAEVVCRVLAAVGTSPAALGRAAYGGACPGTRWCWGASTGRASGRARRAIAAPATTSPRTRRVSSSAPTSRPGPTSTPPLMPSVAPRATGVWNDQDMTAAVASPADLRDRLATTGYLCDEGLATIAYSPWLSTGRCCWKASRARARPRWPRRWRSPWACR